MNTTTSHTVKFLLSLAVLTYILTAADACKPVDENYKFNNFNLTDLDNETVPVIIVMQEDYLKKDIKKDIKNFKKSEMAGFLKTTSIQTQRPLMQKLNKINKKKGKNGLIEKPKNLWLINAISAEIPKDKIKEIEKRDDVKKVYIDRKFKFNLDNSVLATGVMDLWNSDVPYKGEGIIVGVIDSGIDNLHPDLDQGKVIDSRDFVDLEISCFYKEGCDECINDTPGCGLDGHCCCPDTLIENYNETVSFDFEIYDAKNLDIISICYCYRWNSTFEIYLPIDCEEENKNLEIKVQGPDGKWYNGTGDDLIDRIEINSSLMDGNWTLVITGKSNLSDDEYDKEYMRDSFFIDYETTQDYIGHGTHVSGIIAGTGDALNKTFTGVAPEASLLSAKVLDSQGSAFTSDMIGGIQWVIDNDADVISMSIGTLAVDNCDDPILLAMKQANDYGVLFVTAAGNDGSWEYGGGYGTMDVEACYEGSAIVVGAVNDAGEIANFSSAGYTPSGLVGMDILAPGVNITSTASHGYGYYYLSMGGTSMATPFVSGAAALLIQVYEEKNNGDPPEPLLIKSALMSGAYSIGEDVRKQGSGVLNASAAYDILFKGILIEPSTGFFGELFEGENQSIEFTIINNGNDSVCNVSINILDLNFSSLFNISANTSGNFSANLTVPMGIEIGTYGGYITANCTQNPNEIKIPVSVVVRKNIVQGLNEVISRKINMSSTYCYEYDVEHVEVLDVDLKWNQKDNDLDLYVYYLNDDAGIRLESYNNIISSTSSENISIINPESGIYRICVNYYTNEYMDKCSSTPPIHNSDNFILNVSTGIAPGNITSFTVKDNTTGNYSIVEKGNIALFNITFKNTGNKNYVCEGYFGGIYGTYIDSIYLSPGDVGSWLVTLNTTISFPGEYKGSALVICGEPDYDADWGLWYMEKEWFVTESSLYYNITSTKTQNLSGWVKSAADGSPIFNATVTARNFWSGEIINTTFTGLNGKHFMTLPEIGYGISYEVEVSKEGYENKTSAQVIDSTDDVQLNFTLFPIGTGNLRIIVSRYCDEPCNNKEIENAEVYISNISKKTNAFGVVEFNLPQGNYSVTVKKEGHFAAYKYASVVNGKTSVLCVELTIDKEFCDLNNDGMIYHDWNDLRIAYKCFLGINKNCNKINYLEWNRMKSEYECFINNL